MKNAQTLVQVLWFLLLASAPARAAGPGFAEFDRRAREGGTLRVVFFGASLTWGANATDQEVFSYRAQTKTMLEARYPKARFQCYDAAIGGTSSPLGVFRLERDVLARQPDLVFLDFSANDNNRNGNPIVFASYEALLRRIIRDGGAPVVAVMFPFKQEIEPGLQSGTTAHLEGLTRRMEIAAAYGVPAGDAAALIIDRIRKKETTLEQIWDTDGTHPGDYGYRLFAEAAMAAFERAVRENAVCTVPEKMLHDSLFMTSRRVVLADLFPPDAAPSGWALGKPHLTGAAHDQQMSRWLDRLLIASNRWRVKNAKGKNVADTPAPAALRFEVRASYVMVLGEATNTSGKFRVRIDGKPRTHTPSAAKGPTDLYDMTSGRFNGNWNYHETIAENLDPNTPHILEIEPVLEDVEPRELRIESLCVAGGRAEVKALLTPMHPVGRIPAGEAGPGVRAVR
jgi:lysophospholipase L1-like esterase